MPALNRALQPSTAADAGDISPRNSSTPLIPPEQKEQLDDSTTTDPKTGKRRLFGLGLGKKKEKSSSSSGSSEAASTSKMDELVTPTMVKAISPPTSEAAKSADVRPEVQAKAQAQPIPVSPARHPYPSAIAASPSRLRSSSPRMHSPASSEIFERNVQEPVPMSTLQGEAHIPTHVMTEDHIPPALEASAQAITSNSLNPDEVEIVMSASHQLAAASVLEGNHADISQLHSPASTLNRQASDPEPLQQSGFLPNPSSEDEGANSYGQLDPNDVRRLSFISFADIVQSEHYQQAALGEAGSRDSLHLSSHPSSNLPGQDRTASPLRSPRSPASCGGVVTPPPGGTINPINAELSPARSAIIGSPMSGQHGELTIETMRQAVRKTASGDLGANRSSQAMSPIWDEISLRETSSRTNT